ncbi:hypothetical protein Q3G72_025030 [Acer saccharum]|nr:hypothetical protein Q3G72_025030 [Acer saccharum]
MLFQLMVVLSPSSSVIIKPGCPTKCGEIPISFPFGIGAGCYLDDWYAVNCTSSKPFLASIDLELLNISLEANTILVNHPVFNTCGSAVDFKESANLENSPFFFSDTGNILSGRGCYFLASINHNETFAGCYSSCYIKGDPTTCLGINCCQSGIPSFLQFFSASVSVTTEDPDIVKQCKLVFVVRKEWLVRKKWNPGNSKAVPVILDWGIHNSSFHRLNMTTSISYCNVFTNSTSANKSLSTSTTASNSLFHRCNCNGGFQGNPYILQGCQGVATGLPSLLLVLLGAWRLHIIIKRRKNVKLKEKYFKCLLMQQHLTLYDGCGDRGKLFKSKELDKATNHFNVNRILGQGGQGTVYKGMLADGKIIAVKKPKAIDERKLEEFINEQDYEEVEHETHERTEITECWDVDTTSTG